MKNTEMIFRDVAKRPTINLNSLFTGFFQSFNNVKGVKITLSVKDSSNKWHNLQVRQFMNGSIHMKNF